MKLDKLTSQLEGRQQGLAAVFGQQAAPPADPAPQRLVEVEVSADPAPPRFVKVQAAPPADPAPVRRTRQPAASKRSTWKACTFYLPPETKTRLERVLLQRKLAGADGAADQSEAINEALQAWLAKAEKPYT